MIEAMNVTDELRADDSKSDPWQPLSTAPRDGTPILMKWKLQPGEHTYIVARWVGREPYSGWHSCCSMYCDESEVVGWMEIPS